MSLRTSYWFFLKGRPIIQFANTDVYPFANGLPTLSPLVTQDDFRDILIRSWQDFFITIWPEKYPLPFLSPSLFFLQVGFFMENPFAAEVVLSCGTGVTSNSQDKHLQIAIVKTQNIFTNTSWMFLPLRGLEHSSQLLCDGTWKSTPEDPQAPRKIYPSQTSYFLCWVHGPMFFDILTCCFFP